MNYSETIGFLYKRLPVFHLVGSAAYKSGLDNITALCEAIGNPQNKFKSIHVAGTNGKGSTSHLLASILIKSGYKTGLHTSPHLKSFTERFKINGVLMPENEVVVFVEKHLDLIEKIKPSFFEISVALAFDYFARQKVDIAIIEVGLGGRLDSTNIINPILSIITNISYDHTKILGESLPLIATEKAGVIKPNTPIVVSESQPEIAKIFIETAKSCNSDLYFADKIFSLKYNYSEKGRAVVDIFRNEVMVFKSLKLDLLGNYQLKNILGVMQSIYLLKNLGFHISKKNIREAVNHCQQITNFKGRWQQLQRSPTIIADVAHNFSGLSETLLQIKITVSINYL